MSTQTPAEIFRQHGAVHVKDAVPHDLRVFLTEMLLRKAHINKITEQVELDAQIANVKAVISHEPAFDCLLERLWPAVEVVVEESLIPTYAYSRLYSNGDELVRHTDRPACEVSMTIQLARTHHYAWPIYMGGKRFDLGEGDAVIYSGCTVEHWRNPCDGPEDYLSGQVFLHYVRENGQHATHAGDKRWEREMPFLRGRNFILENK